MREKWEHTAGELEPREGDASRRGSLSHSGLLRYVYTRQILQNAGTTAAKPTNTAATTTPTGGAVACGALDPKTTSPPENAVLYLSVRGPGTITYKCVEANKPVVLSEDAKLTETISKGWSGQVETKDGARIVTTENGNTKPPSKNVFTLGSNPTSMTVLNGAPDLRWEVTSNVGASAAEGGIPSGTNYVTRTQAEGGAPPRSCDAGETIKVPFSAAYNIYSCDQAYLAQAPGTSVAPGPTAAAPSVAVAPTPSVTVAPTPSVAVAPIAVPPVAVAPIAVPPVAVAPVPESVSVAPAPAPAVAPPSSAAQVGALVGALGVTMAMMM